MKLFPSLLAGTLAFTLSCDRQGYTGKCQQAIAPLEEHFKDVCGAKTDRTLYHGQLAAIMQERDQLLRKTGCELSCERWLCSRDSYLNPVNPTAGRYTMKVENKRTCP